ncbi:hypothetical protein [Nocardioides okcheonensis]|uniref:hypothetical protein n=1 Tax=Nocardioides okcheonensis TaxID=2894081 RepID=UPI001E2CED1D|nr:hypothetical protein [Nocardioides okcheonensis]UFN43939.1 hypothetical protein LN652_18100 [Nocardioides okcheonensis]
MRHRSRLPTAAPACLLACLLLVTGCSGDRADEGASSATGSASSTAPGETSSGQEDATTPPPLTTIPDDFPLAAGMGAPADDVATARSGAGLRTLELCGTAPLRGLSTRDRMVADNSGGEAADTRELVLLGSPDDARTVARMFVDLATDCDRPDVRDGTRTQTRVLGSAFGPGPATTLLQTYTFDDEPGTGATVVHVVPVGAALLVTSTYGPWTRGDVDAAVARTTRPLRETVAALTAFDEPDDDAGSSG